MEKRLSRKGILQLKITLRDVRPPIWRRILIASETTLATLHDVVQVAMGWHDSHLHGFVAGGQAYAPPDSDFGFGPFDEKDENKARLHQVLPEVKSRLLYEYDFGDSWEHVIVLEAILPRDPKGFYPRLVAGRRACPPEDCGGSHGYQNLLAVRADPSHPDHEEMADWLDKEFDPEALDLAALNALLQEMTRGRRRVP